jgi:hypothetical protein
MLLLGNVDDKLRVRYLRLLVISHQCLLGSFNLAFKELRELSSLERPEHQGLPDGKIESCGLLCNGLYSREVHCTETRGGH